MATPAALNPHPARLKSSRAPKRALVLATACAGVFAGFGSLFIFTFGVFLKPLAAAFGWTRAEVSVGFTAAVLTVAICSPLLGRLLDRYPARRVVLPCTLIYALAFASLALLTAHLWHFVIVLVIMGAVGNGTTQLGYARVVSAWFDQSRGRALAAVMAGSGVGSMVFPPLAQALITSYGWRWAYAALGCLVLLLALPLAAAYLYEPQPPRRYEPEAPRGDESQAAQPADPVISTTNATGIVQDLLSFRFLGIVCALLLFSLATNGLNTHWAALLTDRGLAPAIAAAVLSVAGFATLISKLSTGYLLDRFSANKAVACLLALSAAGLAAILYGQDSALAFTAAAMVGIGMGAESDAVPYLLTRYFGLQRFSELYGYTWTVYAIAGGLGPLLAGMIFDRTASYRIALLAFLAMAIAAAVLFAALPNYRRTSIRTSD